MAEIDALSNFQRIKRNVIRIQQQGGTDDDIEQYLAGEGYTGDTFLQANERVKGLGGAKPADVGFGGRALNSALFNFGDEAFAAMRAYGLDKLPGIGGAAAGLANEAFAGGRPTGTGNYQGEVAAARMGLDEYQRQFPGRAVAADITGALLPAVASGGAALAGRAGTQALASAAAQTSGRAAPTALQGAWQGAKWGALEGALQGAGQGEDLRGRLVGAGTGATGGAVVGGVAGGTLQAFTNWMQGKDIPAQAQRYYLNLINEGGASINDVMAELAKREAIGVSDNITADVMGPAFRARMTSDARNNPQLRNPLEAMLDDRARGQADRLRGSLSEATGGQVTNTAREAAQRLERARAEVAPLYDSFRSREPFVNDPVLTDVVTERPALRSALSATQESLLNRGVRDPSGVRTVETPFPYPPIDGTPMPPVRTTESTFTPVALDRLVKRTNVASDAANPTLTQAQRDVARDTLKARGALLDRIEALGKAGDQPSQDFTDARRIFASAKEYGDQARAGRQFLDADADTAEMLLGARREASQMGQMAFGEGTLDSLGQRLGRSQTVAGRINSAVNRVNDTQAMSRLREAYPGMTDEAYERLVQQMDALAQQTSTRNQAKGAFQQQATHPLFNEDAAARLTSGELSSGLFQGNAQPVVAGALTRGMRQAEEAAQQATREAAAPFYLAQGSRNIAPIMQDLARTRAIDTARDAAMKRAPGLAAGGTVSTAMQNTGIGEQFGIDKDTSVGPAREDVIRGIEQRERFINDPNTPPEERAQFERQRDRLRLML